MKRRLYLLAAPAALGLALVPAVAMAITEPSGNYSVTPSSGTITGAHFTATFNPSNTGYRAFVICSNGTSLEGSWHFGTGTSSNTGACGGHALAAGFDWQKSNPHAVTCWIPGDPRSGTC